MPKSQPLVTFITVNFNQLELTCEMFDSLRKISYDNFEVILVDNASKVNPEAHVRKYYPEVKVIVSDENLGFAGGNNLAIPYCSGEYLFFINNDTELVVDVVQDLLAVFDKVPNLGMVSPKLCYFPEDTDNQQIIQYVGTTPVSNITGRNKTIGTMELDKGQYTELKPTPYAHGAAMMMPRKVLDEVGMMSEKFFLYYEELDWCERIRRAGYEIYVEPNTLIYHKESVSVGKMSAFKTYYLTRNRILFMRRNRTKMQLMFFYLFLITVTIPKNVILYAIKGDWDHLNSFWKGIWWNVQHTETTEKKTLIPA